MKQMKKYSTLLIALLMLNFFPVMAFSGEGQTLNIQGMMCSTCSGKVQKAFKDTGKIESIKVNVKNGTAQVVWKNGQQPSATEIAEIVKAAGFTLKSDT